MHELRGSIMRSLRSRERIDSHGDHTVASVDVLTMTQVRALVRELSTTNVLSVYLDTHATDPPMHDAWRLALGAALREIGSSLSANEVTEFRAAAGCVRNAALPESGSWGAPGWMALATASGVRFAAQLPVRTPTLAVWRQGPVIAPYLRVMKQPSSSIERREAFWALRPSSSNRREHESAERRKIERQ